MAVEIFRGKYVTAEDASNYIDIATIANGCSMLSSASGKIDNVASIIDHLKTVCDQNALSIQGMSLEFSIGTHGTETANFASYISQLSSAIMAAAERAINRKQIMLNEIAKAEDERLERLYASQESKNNY